MTDAPTTPDPVEMAMEANVTGRAPGEAAIRLIDEQRRLVGWEIADRRSGVALKALSALAGIAVAVGLVAMAWHASRADGLVVEAFSVPPDFAARGLTGQVVASQVLDRFNAMQTVTDSIRPTHRSSNDWDHQARVEIPQTGVSIDELERLLRRWLGHERRVGGEVIRGPEGLQLTVRVSGADADTVIGTDAGLSALLSAGAARIYDRTDPTRYTLYILRQGQAAEALARLPRLTQTGSPAERGYAYLVLGLATADHRQALVYGREGVRIAGLGMNNASARAAALGHAEEALALNRRGLRWSNTIDRTPTGHLLRRQSETTVALDHGDPQAAYNAWLDGPNTRPVNAGRAPAQRAVILTAMHAPGLAQRTLGPGADDGALSRRRLHATNGGGVSSTMAGIARERGDWAEALRQIGLARAAVAELPPDLRAPGVGPGAYDVTELIPRMAEALAELGRIPEAQALIATTPTDCYLCLRIRGRVAALAGRPREADRWYAEAVRQAPSLPQADYEWGQAKLARGDTAGAIARFAAARRNGPRFADPVEFWGEALLAKGDAAGASAKFAEAAKLAPRWGRAHLKWGEALAKLGKAEAAQAQWRAAASLDLTAAERAQLPSSTRTARPSRLETTTSLLPSPFRSPTSRL